MCGIAGFVHSSQPALAASVITSMVGALARRGPDAEGFHVFPTASFGHRRLSIYDLSDAGKQPMISQDGQLSVVFNGAIYNHLELRAELEAAGYRFSSRTDTEVLLHGYHAWGIEAMLPRLRGMFAIGLWDNRKERLFLFRDRLGVKPLHYTLQGGNLAFASTARALRAAGLVSEIDPQSVAEFLEYGYISDARSIYRGAMKLAPGTLLEFHRGQLKRQTYWTVPEDQPRLDLSFEEAVKETERLFLEAVRLRLEADVTVGALLSAGIDSSLVCWAIAQHKSSIKAFTVGVPGSPHDESSVAAETARFLGIPHEIVPLSGQLSDNPFQLLSEAFGEPFACSSALGMLHVSRSVRQSATVLLTGDGGDDVFLGYPEHRLFYHTQRANRFLPKGLARGFESAQKLFPDRGAAKRLRNLIAFTSGGLAAVTAAKPGLKFYRQAGLVGPGLSETRSVSSQFQWDPDSAAGLLKEFLDYEHHTRFTGEYMTKVDGATMHYALEARAPFLDQELWNFAARLPYKVRLHDNQLKAILREIARRRIGPALSHAPKRGFTIPIGPWMVQGWRQLCGDLFHSSRLVSQGWIDGPALDRAFQQAIQDGQASTQLWYLAVLEAWLRNEEAALPSPDSARLSRESR
jgi:asparagine synthase (glutamine-hydrolysing)